MNTLLLSSFLFIARLMVHCCFPTRATRGSARTICSDMCLIYLRGMAFAMLKHETDIALSVCNLWSLDAPILLQRSIQYTLGRERTRLLLEQFLPTCPVLFRRTRKLLVFFSCGRQLDRPEKQLLRGNFPTLPSHPVFLVKLHGAIRMWVNIRCLLRQAPIVSNHA